MQPCTSLWRTSSRSASAAPRVAQDQLHGEVVARSREALTDAEVDLDVGQREHVDGFIKIMRLRSQREQSRQPSQRGVVLDTERYALEAFELRFQCGLELGAITQLRQAETEDGVGSEEPM